MQCTKNGKKCAQCLATTSTTGVYVTAAGVCAPCKDAGCATCRKSSGNCVTCLSGLAKKGNKCSECGAGFVVTKKGRCKAVSGERIQSASVVCAESGREGTGCGM